MIQKINVLAVDDDELNLDIIQEYFDAPDFKCITSHDGVEALEVLDKGEHVDVIVLDRMMPNMNGMDFLKKVKADSRYQDIPVIMQTAATASHQVAEGINSGVYYYLSKPYSKEVFLSIVRAANDDCKKREQIRQQMREYGKAMDMIIKGSFRFKTIEEAKALAVLVSSPLPDAEMKLLGLTELMLNSVEHGNLGITYEEKSQLKHQQEWENEIERRLKLPENQGKYCYLDIEQDPQTREFMIKVRDQGTGFDWKKYSEFDPKRLTDPNGRGLLIGNNSGFDELHFLGSGNEFMCKIKNNQ